VGISLGGTTSQAEAIQKLGRLVRKTGGVLAFFYDVYCAHSADETKAKAVRPTSSTKKNEERFLC
jgi:superfamily II DNA or RNA helicase